MNRSNLSRSCYRLLLKLHPTPFRVRFAAEMLWIFEEDSRPGAAARLLGDGMVSLLRQHLLREPEPQPLAAGFGLLETGPALPPRRFAEATLAATLVLAGFILLLDQRGRLFGLPACPPGAPRAARAALQAPFRIDRRPITPQAPSPTPTAAHMDEAVASAIQIARAQDRAIGPGFCAQPR